jgi:murein L,D-transpeptidase YcbB/YkuD
VRFAFVASSGVCRRIRITGLLTVSTLALSALAFPQDAKSQTDPAASLSTPEPWSPVEAGIAAQLSGTDLEVARRLRLVLAAPLKSSLNTARDQAGVKTFYESRGFAPLWTLEGKPSGKAAEVMGYLRGVEADGLNPADYPAPQFSDADAGKIADDEIRLSLAVVLFARHASVGRASFQRVSDAIAYDINPSDPAGVLKKIAETSPASKALDSFLPAHAGYKALKARLAAMLNASPRNSETDSKTREKDARLKSALIANMERWRWLPRDLGNRHVEVNVPDYTLKVIDNGKVVWSTKIIVGKPGNTATPIFSEMMKDITINPTWNVPESIIQNEYLPALRSNPEALSRMGLVVGRNSDGSVRIYQPPGARNALGRIRFNFPNKFSVYQHDTPNRDLFTRQTRAFSHGCMRVKDPDKYAEVLLSLSQPGDRYTAERIRKLYGEDERTVKLKTPVRVHVTYQTVFADESGQLQVRPDIYGLDSDTVAVLNGKSPQLASKPSKDVREARASRRAAASSGERVSAALSAPYDPEQRRRD